MVAIDRSPDVLARARALAARRGVTNVSWEVGEIERLPLADASVDVVLLSQALHHAETPARALAEALRVVAPGGRVLILDLRAHDQDWVRDRLDDRWLGFDDRAARRPRRRRRLHRRPHRDRCLAGRRPVRRRRRHRKETLMTDIRATLDSLLARRVLVLDGAMGTMVQRHSLTEADYRGTRFADHGHDLKGDNDVLVLTQPDIVAGIHDAYLAAGADIIETNTFGATAVAQADYGLEAHVYEMNVEGARHRASGWPRRGRRRRRTSRASSPARSARPTRCCRSRRT